MTQILDPDNIAILYETITGLCQKRLVLTSDEPVDLDAYFQVNSGLAGVIVARSELPGGDQNEAFFREQIASATGTDVFAHGDDRAVMVDPSGTVVSIHLGNVDGLDQPHDNHQLVSHMDAEIGDQYTGTGFNRRYVAVDRVTGRVTHDFWRALNDGPPSAPTERHEVLGPSLYRLGDVIRIKEPDRPRRRRRK